MSASASLDILFLHTSCTNTSTVTPIFDLSTTCLVSFLAVSIGCALGSRNIGSCLDIACVFDYYGLGSNRNLHWSRLRCQSLSIYFRHSAWKALWKAPKLHEISYGWCSELKQSRISDDATDVLGASCFNPLNFVMHHSHAQKAVLCLFWESALQIIIPTSVALYFCLFTCLFGCCSKSIHSSSILRYAGLVICPGR